jgi:predicted enzyme related to lactoylglutathione lyase
MTVRLENTIPILYVSSQSASLDYYTKVLGYTIDWRDRGVASVSRDRKAIMLGEGEQGHPGGWVWIGVTDAGELAKEFSASGALIRHPPTNYPWAYEFQVYDPDQNVLRFGSERREGEPFGEWLYDDGTRWLLDSRGLWQRVGGA